MRLPKLTGDDRQSGKGAVPHGLRSTFRDWTTERTEYPRDMAEIALAHTVGSTVERAYRRGDMLENRRALMADWAVFLHGVA
jgi:integrase